MTRILEPDDFAVIATEGIGRASNATAHSMAYFRGQLYVGASCANVNAADDAPRIQRYDAQAGAWEVVYESLIIDASARAFVMDRQVARHGKRLDIAKLGQRRTQSESVSRDVGFRSMCVFQGRSDPEPALYVTTMSRTGGLILRSADGTSFEPVGEPGLGNPDIYSFRGLKALGGRLFTAPAGTVNDEYLDRIVAPQSVIYVTDDPVAGVWEAACADALGDPSNLGIYDLAIAHGMLYAGTCNPYRGLQVWRTAARGAAPFQWEQVVADGGGAFNHNLATSAMAEFKGALYVGSGITGYGTDTVHDIGPASAELIRIHKDGSWDLIAGRMRFTPDGLKVPLSMLGPGFGDFYNSVIWSLGVHDGVLYMGTHQWEPFGALQADAETIVGGYQLWASKDGESWDMIIPDGRGNPGELGIRTLVSTPLELAVGTNNQGRLLHLLGRRKRDDLTFRDGFEVLLGKRTA